jgi:hypothetical protein
MIETPETNHLRRKRNLAPSLDMLAQIVPSPPFETNHVKYSFLHHNGGGIAQKLTFPSLPTTMVSQLQLSINGSLLDHGNALQLPLSSNIRDYFMES